MLTTLRRIVAVTIALAASIVGLAAPAFAADAAPIISNHGKLLCPTADGTPELYFDFRNTGSQTGKFEVYVDDELIDTVQVGAGQTTEDLYQLETDIGTHEVRVAEIHGSGASATVHHSDVEMFVVEECGPSTDDDLDGDGIPDADDRCPDVPAPSEENGCVQAEPIEYNDDCTAIIIPNDNEFFVADDDFSELYESGPVALGDDELEVGSQTARGAPFNIFTFSRAECLEGVDTSAFVPLTPTRFLDTRTSTGGHQRPVQPGGTVDVQIAGVQNVPSDAVAVAVNLTVTNTQGGYLTLHPSDVERPTTSNVNYNPGQTVANHVLTGLSEDGSISIFASGKTDVIVDVTGYFRESSSFTPMTPQRLLDTRNAIGVDSTTPIPQGGEVDVTVAGGSTGVPEEAVAVALNMTSTQSAANGWITAYPTGEDRPLASNLNYGPNRNVPGLAVVKIGNDQQVTLFSSRQSHLIADVQGYYLADGEYVGLAPGRLVDTRVGTGAPERPVGVGQTLSFKVTGEQGVPPGASAVFLNVTTVGSDRSGYFTVFPSGVSRPTASTLNFAKGQTVANSVFARVGADGKVSIYTNAKSDMIVDVAGYVVDEGAAS